MAGPYDLTPQQAPWSGVSDALQNILAQKRLESRQNMLDQLDVYKTQMNAQEQQARIAGLNEERAATAEWRKAQAKHEQELDDQKWAGNVMPGQVDAATATRLTNAFGPNAVQSQPGAPAVPAPSEGELSLNPDAAPASPAKPATQTYLGSPAYQLEQKQRAYIQSMAQDPRYANNPAVQAYIGALGIPGVKPDIAEFGRILSSKVDNPSEEAILLPNNMYRYKGQIVSSVPPGTAVTRGFEPQQPNAANTPQKYDIVEPDPAHPGQMVTRPHWLRPGEQPSEKNLIKAGEAYKGNEPRTAGSKALQTGLFDPSSYREFTATFDPKIPAAKHVAAGTQLLNQTKMDATMRAALNHIWTSPRYGAMPYDQMVKDPQLGLQFDSPEQEQEFKDRLAVLRNGYR